MGLDLIHAITFVISAVPHITALLVFMKSFKVHVSGIHLLSLDYFSLGHGTVSHIICIMSAQLSLLSRDIFTCISTEFKLERSILAEVTQWRAIQVIIASLAVLEQCLTRKSLSVPSVFVNELLWSFRGKNINLSEPMVIFSPKD